MLARLAVATLSALAAFTVPGPARAVVIEFEAPPSLPLAGTYIEDGYTYGELSGDLLIWPNGNPGKAIQSMVAHTGGGVLSITRNGLEPFFTLAGLDYAAYGSSGSQVLDVRGYLFGSEVGLDSFATTNGGALAYATFATVNLAGVVLDELRITFNSTSPIETYEAVDNVQLESATYTPEPASLAMLAAGLLGLGLARRDRRAG